MPTRSLLGEDEAADLDIVEDPGPVSVVGLHAFVEHLAAVGAEVALDDDLEVVEVDAVVEFGEEVGAELGGDESEGFLVHGAVDVGLGAVDLDFLPAEGVEGARVGAGVVLHALFEESGEGALGASDGSVEEEDATFGAVAVGGGLEDVDEAEEGFFEAEDGIVAVLDGVIEEVVAGDLFLVDDGFLGAEAEDHVVEALIGGAGDLGVGPDDVEVFGEGAVPVGFLVFGEVLAGGEFGDQIRS